MPQSTIALLEKALEAKHAAAWARDLNVHESTFSQARKRGRLSPTLAGTIAQRLNEDPEHWIAIAALEAEPATPLRERLIRAVRKL